MAITLPLLLAAPTRLAAIWLQPPAAAPRSTTVMPGLRKWYLSSISISLNAARERNPSRLACATYGSLSWRSSQSFEDSLRLPPVLTVTCSRPVVSLAIMRLSADHAVLAHQFHQHSLARPAIGDTQSRQRKRVAYSVKYRAACQHQIGALHADAIVVGSLLIAHAEQARDGRRDVCIVQPYPIDPSAIVSRQIEMNTGERRHRARSAEQVHIPEFCAVLGRERHQVLSDLIDHACVGVRSDVLAAKMFGQLDHAERNRHPSLDPRRGVLLVRIALDPDQFGRSAADVEQNGAPPSFIE